MVGFQDAYISAQAGKLIVSLGRAREAWLGDGQESLVLSANGPALDRLLLSLRFSKFQNTILNLAGQNGAILKFEFALGNVVFLPKSPTNNKAIKSKPCYS